MRRKLPYEIELVPTRNGIAITNTTDWNRRDLVVSWGEKGSEFEGSMLMKGSLNRCMIDGLAGDKTYSIRLRRSDLRGRLLYKPFESEVTVRERVPTYAVLVGASVGKAWDLPSLPDRTGNDDFVFGYRGKYGYDKGDALDRLVEAQLRPDLVIIKECAAYFPGELEPSAEKLPQWVDLLKANGMTPVLATCCPVTEANDGGNPGRQEAIDEFNRFVRDYARENGLCLLDLAKALRVGETNSHLRSDYAQPDGLHLAPKAYAVLDLMAVPSLIRELRHARPEKEPASL